MQPVPPPVPHPALDKHAVAERLRRTALLLQLKGENPYRVRAYETAADRVAGLGQDLGQLVAEDRLTELPGIGEALAEHIRELVTTGRLHTLEQLEAQFPPGLLELLQVPDLGPRKLMTLWHELGVGDVAALERACREGRVRAVKGFGEKSEARILEGLAQLQREGTSPRRRLGDVLPLALELLARVQEAPGVVRASLAGSVRRSRETVADVDLLASAPDAGPVLAVLTGHPRVARVLGSGESKASVRLREPDLQVDLRVLPDEDFATALHHFTGSKAHHVRLRHLAREKGLTISEWGVFRETEGTKLPVRTEGELYALLGMQEVPPELREDTGEVEAALAGALPEDLVSAADVRGIVHSHSTWSDGKASLEEMARTAAALGMTYLTVTEHSEAAIYAGGLTVEALQRQWEEIDRINALLPGFRLLRGIEVDILETGALDYPDSVLEKLEVVIGSIHVRHGLDEEAMTQRVLRALDNPHLHILGHPTGRLILDRDPYPLRMEAVVERAAERGVALEVNGNPHRLDLKDEHVRLAVKQGARLVLSSDAHRPTDVGPNVRYAAATARRGWARRSHVLNTLCATDFLRALRDRRA